MKYTVDDLYEMMMAYAGLGKTVLWPVLRGNNVIIMEMLERTVRRAEIGDRLAVKDGGWVEKVDTQSWVQWHFLTEEQALAKPLIGKLLRPLPVSPQAQSDADHGETQA